MWWCQYILLLSLRCDLAPGTCTLRPRLQTTIPVRIPANSRGSHHAGRKNRRSQPMRLETHFEGKVYPGFGLLLRETDLDLPTKEPGPGLSCPARVFLRLAPHTPPITSKRGGRRHRNLAATIAGSPTTDVPTSSAPLDLQSRSCFRLRSEEVIATSSLTQQLMCPTANTSTRVVKPLLYPHVFSTPGTNPSITASPPSLVFLILHQFSNLAEIYLG